MSESQEVNKVQEAALTRAADLLAEHFPGAVIVVANTTNEGNRNSLSVRYSGHASLGKGLLWDAYSLVFESDEGDASI